MELNIWLWHSQQRISQLESEVSLRLSLESASHPPELSLPRLLHTSNLLHLPEWPCVVLLHSHLAAARSQARMTVSLANVPLISTSYTKSIADYSIKSINIV